MISGTRFRLTAEINRQARLAQDIARAQTEISTGKRILAPSDDPTGAARVAEIARTQANETTWKQNVDAAAALAARADTTLSTIGSRIDRAAELMVNAANGTLPDDARATIAAELRGIAEEITSLTETRDARGTPLFRSGEPLAIPVSAGLAVAPVDSREAIFDNVQTAGGPMDLVSIITTAADAIVQSDPAVRGPATQASLDAVQAATRHIAAVRGEQGVRASRIDRIAERLADSGLQIAEERKNLESTDVTEVVAKLQAKQLSLEAAQAVFARVNQNSLFDLLR